MDILLGSPERNGQLYNIRLSLSPKVPSCADALREEYERSILCGKTRDAHQSKFEGETSNVLLVPVEVLLHILKYVDPATLGCLRRVCRSWKTVVDVHQEYLFKPLCMDRGWFARPNEHDVSRCRSSESSSHITKRDVKGWMEIFATNYSTHRNWLKRSTFSLTPWNDSKAMTMTYSAQTWGDLLEASLAA